jgi:hypothetical protein
MSTAFQDLCDEMLAEVDEVFAEPVKLFFLKNGTADPARANVEIMAILRVGNVQSTTPTGGMTQSWGMRIAAGKAELTIARDSYTGPLLRAGDKVRALSRHDQPWWEVTFVNDRNATRLIAELNQA